MAVGFVGIFVPLLPTTPFVLLAAVCYSRGSERFHTWLHQHPHFGPMIHSWREHRAIGTRAKVVAAITVVVSITYSVIRLAVGWHQIGPNTRSVSGSKLAPYEKQVRGSWGIECSSCRCHPPTSRTW
jgi:uncharacterized membrane protein YbaN (DUF454 family)